MFAGMTRWLTALAAAAGVAASAGCGGGSHAAAVTNAPARTGTAVYATIPAEWRVVEGAGFNVQLHTGWLPIDAARLARSRALATLEAANPQLAYTFKRYARVVSQPGVLLAFDRSDAGRRVAARWAFAPNIIIRPVPLNLPTTDADLLRHAIAGMKAAAGNVPTAIGLPSVAHLRIAGVPAGAVTYTFRETTARGAVGVTESDYVTVRKGTMYMLSCTTVQSDVTRLKPICQHALSSFAFTD